MEATMRSENNLNRFLDIFSSEISFERVEYDRDQNGFVAPFTSCSKYFFRLGLERRAKHYLLQTLILPERKDD
jgi:hypothetical protein